MKLGFWHIRNKWFTCEAYSDQTPSETGAGAWPSLAKTTGSGVDIRNGGSLYYLIPDSLNVQGVNDEVLHLAIGPDDDPAHVTTV